MNKIGRSHFSNLNQTHDNRITNDLSSFEAAESLNSDYNMSRKKGKIRSSENSKIEIQRNSNEKKL